MGRPVILLDGVVSLLGSFPALAGIDLAVDAGQVVVVKGPNGAGKSTLLRVCAGLAPIRQGAAEVLGHDLTTRPGRRAVRRSVGLVGHASSLYDDLTVVENVVFWTRAAGADEARIAPALAELGLDGRLADVPVRGLSAGQRRRTSFAVLLCRRPALWLLDEPHGGLDPAGRDLVDRLVRSAAVAGATVVLASHDLDRAEALADRVVTIVGGSIEGRGEAA